MNNFEVTFTAKSPLRFTGSPFRRKRFVPLIEIIIARYLPFSLKYPAIVTITGDSDVTKSITISNNTQSFSFTYPAWDNGWYSFDSILAEELNADRKTKKVLHIYAYGVYYFDKVTLEEAVIDIHTMPFQNALLVLKDEQKSLPKHYNNSKELVCRLCAFMKTSFTFSFLDIVKIVLSVFNMHISDFDILNIEGVINFYHGRLVSAKSYFDGAVVEAYFTDRGCELTCITKHSIVQKFSDGCIAFKCDLTGEAEWDAELKSALEKIEITHKQTYLLPTK